jgi:hypothetical protein
MTATIATPPVALNTAHQAQTDVADAKPRFWRTYALAYAIGALWLAVEIILIGTQKSYTFTGVYVAAFMFPPFMISGQLMLLDRRGASRTLVARALGMTVVAGLVSILSTVILTPLLILMFREGVGHSLAATGAVSWVSLGVVASPLVVELVRTVREGRVTQAATLVVGLLVVAVELSMALSPSGELARSLRRDQGAFLMVTASWIMPVFALATAYIRRLETD